MESDTRRVWLSHLLSTDPADRPRAESSLRDLYGEGGFNPPTYFFWFDSPFRAAWAAFLFDACQDGLKRRMLAAFTRQKRGRELIEGVRADLCAQSQSDWEALTAIVGGTIMYNSWIPNEYSRIRTILPELAAARGQLHLGSEAASAQFDDSDNLHRAEQHLTSVLRSHGGFIDTTIEYPLAGRYSFSEMALDEAASLHREALPILVAAWTISRSAGRWCWPFQGCVVLSERPVEIHVNDKSLLHCADGPALIYRDGTRVWAWNGCHVREDWMLHPEKVPAINLQCCEPSFRRFVEERVGTPVRKTRLKPSVILTKSLPTQSAERVELLRNHNKGRLLLFDRYVGGDHKRVWEELIELGPSVREDPYAADALAVAYETMVRVAANVCTITARLASSGYAFEAEKPHDPPSPHTSDQIARLEKLAGALPLSLRAFYDVVGAVDWTGEHLTIAPASDAITPDPLVVYSVEDVLQQFEEEEEEEDEPNGESFLIVIAPDALHKANTSGGEPYEIAVPDLRADGPLLFEAHELSFVEYLRLVFRYGGFPGYDGIDPAPAGLESLSRGLTPF